MKKSKYIIVLSVELYKIIKTLKEVPSGHLYAHMMSKVSLDDYQLAIDLLKEIKVIKEDKFHMLTFVK